MKADSTPAETAWCGAVGPLVSSLASAARLTCARNGSLREWWRACAGRCERACTPACTQVAINGSIAFAQPLLTHVKFSATVYPCKCGQIRVNCDGMWTPFVQIHPKIIIKYVSLKNIHSFDSILQLNWKPFMRTPP